MNPIRLKDWIPMDPNRALRRKIEKEGNKLVALLNIEKAFTEAVLDGKLHYDLILGYYKDKYNSTADLLFSKNKFECFDVVENYIELKYGYEKVKFRKSQSTIKILEPIRNFINRFNK